MPEKRKVIDITLKKEGMESVINLKVSPEIEDYFKRASQKVSKTGYTETSNKWFDAEGEGLEFYKKNEKLSDKVESYPDVMDNFGNGIMEGNRINLALLRIVGISGEDGVSIKTEDLLGHEEANVYVQKLADWVVQFYQNHLRDHSLSASITLELE